MLKDTSLHEFEEKLLARRREIEDWRRSFRSSWQSLSEQEKELEESALKENMARDIERFDHRHYLELLKIDDALARIEAGTYGLCATCGEPISPGRLHAIPWARECVECAEQRETFDGPEPLSVAEQLQENEISDEEICETVAKEISDQGKIEAEGLKVTCTEGVVQLSGVLRSPSQHQMVLELVHERLGLDDVLDRIEISEAGWVERSEAEDEDEEADPEEKQNLFEGEDAEVDPHRAMTENEPMVPPDDFIEEED